MSGDYGASEGYTGTNLDLRNAPEDTVYTLAADQVYMEFIPLYTPNERHDAEEEQHLASTADYLEGQPVGMADVKIGQLYELVFTNTAGGSPALELSLHHVVGASVQDGALHALTFCSCRCVQACTGTACLIL